MQILDTPVHKLMCAFGLGLYSWFELVQQHTIWSRIVVVWKKSISNKILSSQEQLEHAEVSTALRYLGQYYFKNKLYDEASLCAQRCCDYNDVSVPA